MLVTGGTGYVGSHSIAALASAGHRIRVLARSPERIPAALEPLGVDGVETTIGDVTEPAAVERALQGCDAVLHAASVFSMDARKADEMQLGERSRHRHRARHRAPARARPDRVRVERARAAPAGRRGGPHPGLAGEAATWPYCRSKADSELVARKYQALGAPVVSVMPAALWGPQDPHLGEGVTLATNVLRNRYPVVMRGRDAYRRRPRRGGGARRGDATGPGTPQLHGHRPLHDDARNSSARSATSAVGASGS